MRGGWCERGWCERGKGGDRSVGVEGWRCVKLGRELCEGREDM